MNLSDHDTATLAHVRSMIDAYQQQKDEYEPTSFAWAEAWNGVFISDINCLLAIIERLTRPAQCGASWMNGDGEVMTCRLTAGHDSLHRNGQNLSSHALNDTYAGRHGKAGA